MEHASDSLQKSCALVAALPGPRCLGFAGVRLRHGCRVWQPRRDGRSFDDAGAMEMLKSLVAAAGRGDVDGSGWENGAGGVDGAVAKAWAAFEIAMDVIEAGAALSGMGVTTCGAQ